MCKAKSPPSPKPAPPIQYLHNPLLDSTSAARLGATRTGATSLVVPRNTGLGIGYSRSQNALAAESPYVGVDPTGKSEAFLTPVTIRGNSVLGTYDTGRFGVQRSRVTTPAVGSTL